MAIIKAINSKSSVKNIIKYVADQKKTEEKLMSGKDCSEKPNQAIEDMKMTKELYKKTTGRQYKHFVQSFDPNDKITPEKAHQIGKEWAEKTFKGYEVFIATHTDKEHLHNHFVVNSVSFETGEKLRYSSKELQKYKEISDKICEREGISRTPSNSKNITTFNMKKYKAIEKGLSGGKKSYLVEIGKTVEKNILISTSKEEFISNMEKEGYKVKWSDTRKHITYEDKEGNRARADTLAETFKENNFKKEEMLKQFEQNKLSKKYVEKVDIEKEQEKLNKIQKKISEIEDIRKQLREIKASKENRLQKHIKDTEQITKLKNLIKNQEENKKGLGLGIFKKNRIEKKSCDDRIGKFTEQINVLQSGLLSNTEISKLKEEIADLNSKINWTTQKIIDCNNQLQKQAEEIKKLKEQLEKEQEEKKQRELNEDKKQRIPSSFREKDMEENKKKPPKKKIIKRSVEHER